jgi:methylated-DNA-[protein]-cysteine S-methyltransferase
MSTAGVVRGLAAWGPVALAWREDPSGFRCTGIFLPPDANRRKPSGGNSRAESLLTALLRPRRRTTAAQLELLDREGITAFAWAVMRFLALEVGPGQRISYGDLAAAVGAPGAARAVGSVMRRNRYPLLVPCHRVVAAGGRLGGFQDGAPGGAALKEAMLAEEAAG